MKQTINSGVKNSSAKNYPSIYTDLVLPSDDEIAIIHSDFLI